MKHSAIFVLFVILVAIQLVIIGFLGFDLRDDLRVARSYSINEIDRETIQKVEASNYENFYEINVAHYERDNQTFEPTPNPITPSHTSVGFRERHLYPIDAEEDVVRIIALGDSNTYGLGVRIEDVFTEVFEDLLNTEPLCAGKKYEVINLGVPGYDLLFAEERFRLSGAVYNPDAILWLLYPNDFTEYKDEQLRLSYEYINEGVADTLDGGVGEYTVREVRELYSKGDIEDLQLSAIQNLSRYYSGNIVLFSGSQYLDIVQHLKLRKLVSRTDTIFSFFPFYEIPQELFLDNGHADEEGHAFIARKVYDHFSTHPELLPTCTEESRV